MDAELDPGVRYLLDESAAPAQPKQSPGDETLLRRAMQAAEYEAAQARLAAARKGAPRIDSREDQGRSGSTALIEWQSRTDANWSMRLSPFDPVKTAKGLLPNFAEFAFKFADEGEDEDADDEAQGYDSLGAALSGSNTDYDQGRVEKWEDTLSSERAGFFDPVP